MNVLNAKLALFAVGLMAVAEYAGAESVKIYGVQALADLSNIAVTIPQMSLEFLSLDGSRFEQPVLTWASAQDRDGDGIVDLGRNSQGQITDPAVAARSNPQGWFYADQLIKISQWSNTNPGWVMQIYTDNLVVAPTYQGVQHDATSGAVVIDPQTNRPQLLRPGAVNGLVAVAAPNTSSEDINGLYVVPMAWRLAATSDGSIPCTPRIAGVCMPPKLGNEVLAVDPTPHRIFDDFATHFMADKGDTEENSAGQEQPTWWENIADPTRRDLAKNYQSVLSSDGAALGEYYRSPFQTSASLPYYLYVAAKFPQGTPRAMYHTTIFLEMNPK